MDKCARRSNIRIGPNVTSIDVIKTHDGKTESMFQELFD